MDGFRVYQALLFFRLSRELELDPLTLYFLASNMELSTAAGPRKSSFRPLLLAALRWSTFLEHFP